MLSGNLIIDQLKQANVEYVLSVPDIVTSDGLLWPISRDKDFQLIRVCKEDEAVSIAAGLSFTNKRALILIQNTGFFDSINAIRVMAVEYQLPICMMVGLQGKEPDLLPHESAKYSVRICEPMADVLEIERHLIQTSTQTEFIRDTIDLAYTTPKPVVFFLGKSPKFEK